MMLLTFTLLTTNYTVKHFAVVFFVVWRVTIIESEQREPCDYGSDKYSNISYGMRLSNNKYSFKL